jgi:hypothetical protein
MTKKQNYWWTILLMILFLSATTLQAQSRAIRPVNIQIPNEGEVQLYQGSHALVIGVSDYQDNAWVDLESVGADVKAVRETLEEQGFVVETLMNPTKNRLLTGITDFIDTYGYEQENRLLFYYAGHGHTQERNGRKFGYLVPVDAPNPFENEKVFYRKSLKMEQVISWSKQIESKHALFVFDSCFSGSVLQSRAITVPEDISYLTTKPVRQFISAGSANQTVPSESVFRPLFIRGINGKADLDKDGYVTGVELGMYLQKQVPRYQTGQTPQYGKILDPYLDEGNFVFEVGNRRRPPTTKIEPIQQSKTVTLYISKDDLFKDLESNPASWKNSRNLDSDTVYVGEVTNGVPNGQGTYIFPNGDKYVGETKDGLPNGHGTYTLSSGAKYVGAFKDGNFNGQGTSTWPNGQKYVGEWKDSKKNGQGTYTWPNGEKYVGAFKDGKSHGQGTYTWSKGKFAGAKYVGEWKDSKKNGQGTYTWPDDWKYVGEWKDDKKHGQGTYTWPDGRKYVGEFKNDKRNGQGTYTWPDGRKYVGEFKNDKRNGQGTYTWPDGRKYVGEYKDDKNHGQGTWTHPDGEKYVGEWKDDKNHGQGTYTWSKGKFAGAKYVGEYKDGLLNGQGTYTWPNGEKYVGEWKDDKKHGQGTYIWPDGRVWSGLWEDNRFLSSK